MAKSTLTRKGDGTKQWTNEAGQLHREDGPAIEWYDGSKSWYQNGLLHRLDGPAVEDSDGTTAWHYNGRWLSEDLKGFWKLWDLLDEEGRQNVNLHMWLVRLTNV